MSYDIGILGVTNDELVRLRLDFAAFRADLNTGGKAKQPLVTAFASAAPPLSLSTNADVTVQAIDLQWHINDVGLALSYQLNRDLADNTKINVRRLTSQGAPGADGLPIKGGKGGDGGCIWGGGGCKDPGQIGSEGSAGAAGKSGEVGLPGLPSRSATITIGELKGVVVIESRGGSGDRGGKGGTGGKGSEGGNGGKGAACAALSCSGGNGANGSAGGAGGVGGRGGDGARAEDVRVVVKNMTGGNIRPQPSQSLPGAGGEGGTGGMPGVGGKGGPAEGHGSQPGKDGNSGAPGAPGERGAASTVYGPAGRIIVNGMG